MAKVPAAMFFDQSSLNQYFYALQNLHRSKKKKKERERNKLILKLEHTFQKFNYEIALKLKLKYDVFRQNV